MSSYHFPSTITGSNIPKWDFILNYCSDCPRTNAPDLESSKQLDCLFTVSLHKVKFHIFQNISKCSIRGLIPFKYKNIYGLCDLTPDKDNRLNIILKKSFVLHEEAADLFYKKMILPK